MKHILMVDDVATNLKLAAEVLGEQYRLSMARSGEQALEFLTRAKPDLILLDINMPDISGYQMMERLKSEDETRDIPVIFLTADTDRESEIKGLKMGAMDFIRKPFEPSEIRSRIHRALQRKENGKNIEMAAGKDALTGFWNRQYMEQLIEQKLTEEAEVGCFVLLHIDGLKGVSEHMGHAADEHILPALSQCIRSAAKGQERLISRLKEDEFAVFLPQIKSSEEAERLAKSIQQETRAQLYGQEKCREQVLVSIGITLLSAESHSFTDLYHEADKALYHVMQNGKGGWHLYRRPV